MRAVSRQQAEAALEDDAQRQQGRQQAPSAATADLLVSGSSGSALASAGQRAAVGDDAEELVEFISWGQNAYGELAHGDVAERNRPEVVRYVQQLRLGVKQVVAGNEHTAVLTATGQVYCCGYNDSGQCGLGHNNRVHTLQHVETLADKNVAQIASGNGCEHVLAITQGGELYAWGYNSRGQLGLGTTSHTVLPRLNESLRGKCVVRVACSYYHTVLSTSEDELYAMGRNDYGQLGVGDNLDKTTPAFISAVPNGMVLSIACGQYHTVISIDGAGVYSCGKNDYGQLGLSSAGADPRQFPVPVAAPLDSATGRQVTQVACGYYHSLALTEDGAVYVWGRNDYGQLGLGDKTNYRQPQRVQAIQEPVVQICSGCYHSLMLTDDGKVFAQGRNNHGQLGTSSELDSMVPVKVEALKDHRVSALAAGFYHSVCLTGNVSSETRAPQPSLSTDLAHMLNNPARADVEFLVEGKRIFAHRCIIMARCEPLEKMLDGPMCEASQHTVQLPSLQYNVVLALLEFLYTDQVAALDPKTVDIDFALDLLSAADQFLVERLKCLCEIAIQKSITTDNVALMFRTADTRQAAALRKRCFEFMLKNFGKVIGTDGFTHLPRDLLREVLNTACMRGVTIRPTSA